MKTHKVSLSGQKVIAEDEWASSEKLMDQDFASSAKRLAIGDAPRGSAKAAPQEPKGGKGSRGKKGNRGNNLDDVIKEMQPKPAEQKKTILITKKNAWCKSARNCISQMNAELDNIKETENLIKSKSKSLGKSQVRRIPNSIFHVLRQ